MGQSEKLLRLLQEIHYIYRREGATLQELIDGGAVSARTVYRDIEALSQSGLRCISIRSQGGPAFCSKCF